MAATDPWITAESWTAPANYQDEVRAATALPAQIALHDVTMRDGEGTPGVAFTRAEKLAIARKLDEVGVGRIEVGHAAPDDLAALREAAALGLRASLWCWCGPDRQEIDDAVAAGCDGLIVGIPVGQPMLRALGVSESETIRRSVEAVRHAKESGRRVTYFPWDTTRADLVFLRGLVAEVAERARPDAVAVVDTRGVCLPEGFAYLVRELKAASGLPVEAHPHNDFGLAVANALGALSAGAEVVHVGVAGLGERCGNCPLEALVMALKLLHGRALGLRLELLAELATLVAQMACVPIAPNQPVIGAFQFVRVTDGGIQTLRRDPRVVFPYSPEAVGRQWEVWLGKVSGPAAVTYKLDQFGLSAPAEQLAALVALVQEQAVRAKRALTDEEFLDLARRAGVDGAAAPRA